MYLSKTSFTCLLEQFFQSVVKRRNLRVGCVRGRRNPSVWWRQLRKDTPLEGAASDAGRPAAICGKRTVSLETKDEKELALNAWEKGYVFTYYWIFKRNLWTNTVLINNKLYKFISQYNCIPSAEKFSNNVKNNLWTTLWMGK